MKRSRKANVWAAMVMAVTLTSLFLSAESPAASYTVLELPTGGIFSEGAAISADGSTVTGTYYTQNWDQSFAFIWTAAGGTQSIGALGDYGSYAYDISSDGSTIVGTSKTGPYSYLYPFKWTAAGGMEALEILGEDWNAAYGVSADGSVIVGYSEDRFNDDASAVRWTSAGLELLGNEGDNSEAKAVSADGSVIAGTWPSMGFRWTAESGMETLPTLGGYPCNAQCISDDGTIITGISKNADDVICLFRWTEEGGMENLGILDSDFVYSDKLSMSADGSVIVGMIDTGAFIWTEATGILDLVSELEAQGLDLQGWTIDYTEDVTILADGSCSIVVTGTQLTQQALLINMAVPVPEPATMLTLAIAGSGVVLKRRKRKQLKSR